MNKGNFFRVLALGFLVFFLLSPLLLSGAQAGLKGNIIGFIYDRDGTTPLEGAVVTFKSLTSGTTYQSSKSDPLGIFKVQEVESGMYTYGVASAAGDFNANNILGIKVGENETAKMSIVLRPYAKDEAAAVAETLRSEEPNGESLVAIIAAFDPATRMGQLQMVKGIIRLKDRIHAKGQSTDFYQEVGSLKVGDAAAPQILGSQTGSIRLDRSAQKGDRVYLVRNRRIFPFFLTPAGVAAVIAGNSAVTHGVVRIKDEGEPVSAYK